ncbi:MAG: hypothetical protein JO316_09810 [Abitibacteriaceae bacterium]|nr:hypothetical protein [Abditibacteriaceae bacterium]
MEVLFLLVTGLAVVCLAGALISYLVHGVVYGAFGFCQRVAQSRQARAKEIAHHSVTVEVD